MRLAETPPRYCASCYGQYPDKRHVDFESAFDGPVFKDKGTNYPVDDLIICEDCLAAAAKKIGYIQRDEILKENFELGRACEAKDKTVETQNKIIGDLEHTIRELLHDKDKTIRKGQGQPSIRLPQGSFA